MSAEPLRIGILGAARIAPLALISPARATGAARAVAVAARDADRARSFAEAHDLPIVADDYEALIRHPEVEAIYVALPPARHAEMTLAALEAGKPVLCEKPFAMDAAQAREMTEAAEARGLVLMEAFHYRYHPLFDRVLEIAASGEIGPVRRIVAAFRTSIAATPRELRYDPALGGGALMDLGTYCIHWCRAVAGGEPRVTRATAMIGETGVDISTHANLAFEGGVTGHIDCDMASPSHACLEIEGQEGRIKATNPLAPQLGHLIEVEGLDGARRETCTRDPTYDFQLRAFVAAVQGGRPPITSGLDSVRQMAALDAVRAAVRQVAEGVRA
ncbi:MAG: Gfo/Idh/MocA family protein [Phenylobacterium sp.]|uniref:Gfo/Idh/MocA family protein n=1 Tax=Phenylobacterium sp. TaxID=1871053 RepID=UPI00391D2446